MFEFISYSPELIIQQAIQNYNCKQAVVLLSGGYDSATMAAYCIPILKQLNIPTVIYHGDTTIGIDQVKDYVVLISRILKTNLVIRTPPTYQSTYEYQVLNFGFPGATKTAHSIMYRHLKGRALRRFISHEIKSSVYARENVLVLSGVRRSESAIRMGYTEATRKEKSIIWCNPFFYKSEADVLTLRRDFDLPINIVKEKMCVSGECFCGAYAAKNEWDDLGLFFPDFQNKITKLAIQAKKNGFHWDWGAKPDSKKSGADPNQLDLFLCSNCRPSIEHLDSTYTNDHHT